jgi:tRNA modification GTPase
MNKLQGWDDTIVALATPPGIGAIGVIRLSGPAALAIGDRLFLSKKLSEQPSHTLQVGLLTHQGRALDEVVVSLYKNPRSYTGEDVVEFSCHGSPYVLQEIIAACLSEGARLARPGEFTQRAFLKGKLDLTQAEAVADLIAAGTRASQRTALQGLKGGFSAELSHLREQLLQFSALLELELDFSQEDVEFADRDKLTTLLGQLERSTATLLQSFQLGNAIRNGVSVAIIGKPNAGKSTLLNSLLNENRALVSDIPGTTRDTIEEVLNIEGILFRLIDTAGLREHTTDRIESAGMERSLEKMRSADLVLYVYDSTEPPEDAIAWQQQAMADGLNFILVANKSDLTNTSSSVTEHPILKEAVLIAAKTRQGLPLLTEAMVAHVLTGALDTEHTIVTNARHFQALQEVHKALLDAQRGLIQSLPGDLLALEVRRCLHYLGEITGEITNEDQLDFIFSKFCIGK